MIEQVITDDNGEEISLFLSCPHCLATVQRVGPDGIDYCSDGCGCIEGETLVYTDEDGALYKGEV